MKLLILTIFITSVICYSQTKEEVYNYLLEIECKHPEIVYKQVMFETKHLKCTNCTMDYNNLLGWRYNHKNLVFNHWKESLDYYKDWQIRRKYKESEDYYEFLKRVWGVSDMDWYIGILKRIKNPYRLK